LVVYLFPTSSIHIQTLDYVLLVIQQLHKQFQDPRVLQIVSLGSFLGFGLFALNWNSNPGTYAAILSVVLLTQSVFIHFLKMPWSSLKSGLITGLGLCLLLHSSAWYWAAFAAFLAIGSKFILAYKKHHFFNPANFGIIASILLTGETWISPGQWGSQWLLAAVFGSAALLVLFTVSRLETGLTFLLVYAGLLVARKVFYLGWGVDTVIHALSNGSLLLFAFFMITDPKTIPNRKIARIIWAAIIASISFYLTEFHYVQTAGIWVLFFFTPFTVLFNKIWKGEKFQWNIKTHPI
jgi:Na+-transporting NADH:ubiquinone oxidoreductase subunit NqrB